MDPLIKREVISLFNSDKPKDGINKITEWCASNNKDSAAETAKFFREEKNNLDLVAVGDYLGTDGEDNKKVLDHFVKQFDFKDKNYLKSLREFLKAFKLPGEAQKIDRLVESFASKYYKQNATNEINHVDAAFISAYATVGLNTNLHNPSVKDKWTIDQFKDQLKGLNTDSKSQGIKSGKNFSNEFLENIYNGIKAEPFESNFIETATGYEIAGISSQNDKTFKKLDNFLTAKTDIKNVFSNLENNVTTEHKQPKTWLNKFTGYEGSISVKAGDAEVEIQVYKPNILSKWFLGEKNKLVIQPKGGSEQSLKLAVQIAASFETKVTSIKATYDYLKQDLENYYNTPEQELRKANSVVDLHNQIKETTAKVQQIDPEISDTKNIPLASETNFQDLQQAEIGMQPAQTQPAKKTKINTLVKELAWRNTQKKQAIDVPVTKSKEPKVQINNHQKRLEELKQKQEELQNKKQELEGKKANSNITREEKWKIAAELEGIGKHIESIKKEYNTINTAAEREKQFNNNNSSQFAALKGEPTAADLQHKGAMEAIRFKKEQRLKEETASKAIIADTTTTQPLKSGIPIPPPLPPGKGAPIPPPPPPPTMPGNNAAKPAPMPTIPPKLQETLSTIHISQEGNKQQGKNAHQEELRKILKKRNSLTKS